MTASIGESLTILAHVAGVPLGGLDEDQLDIVALRLITQCGERPVLTSIARIVEDVRQTEGADGQSVAHERRARLRLIGSHTAGDAVTGVFPVPRRPEVPLLRGLSEDECRDRVTSS